MNHVYRTVWSVARQCYVAASEMSRARGKTTSKPSTLVRPIVLGLGVGMGSVVLANDVTNPVNISVATPTIAAAIVGSPGTGPTGQAGRNGYYTCNQMTWGAACAKFYGFGDYTLRAATNGANAPGGANSRVITVENPNILDIVNASDAVAGNYTVAVTQLASGQIWGTQKSGGGVAALTGESVLNSGYAFDLVLTPTTGSAVLVNAPAGTSLNGLAALLNAQNVLPPGYGAVVENAGSVASPDMVLKINGPTGAGNNFNPTTRFLSFTPNGANSWSTTAPATGALNGGQAFSVNVGGTNVNMTAGSTLADLQAQIDALVGYTATLSGDVLTVSAAAPWSAPVSSSVSRLAFDLPPTTITYEKTSVNTEGNLVTTTVTEALLGSTSQDAVYSVNGGTQTQSSTNEVTIGGSTVLLSGTSNTVLSVQDFSNAIANGNIGNVGVAGLDIAQIIQARNVAVVANGAAFVGSTTGGQAGDAQIGGTGGTGGKGGDATTFTIPRIMVIVFLPLTIPDTDAQTIRGAVGGAGSQGGLGGLGQVGGSGGAINVILSANSVTADTLSTMTSTGGQGGAGGVGGPGGMGGAGGNAAAAVEANDFIPFVKSDLGNTGGIGGTGGLGGNGGTGGAGGSVVLNTTFTQAIAMNGQQATSLGGKGGSGGQGGQGGQGGTGGLGVAMSVGIGTGVENGSAGGLAGAGFTGGQGGIGGAGGAVTLTNQGGDLVVSNIGLLALSQGGEGGTGGQGGQGGTGGSGGNGRGAAVLGVNDVVSNGGAAGDGFTAGVGGSAGMGGAGGSASISNLGLNGSIVAGVNAIHATSRGGIGGIGGKGGTGGTGGTGGLPGLVNPIAERGYGGRAGLSGAGGNGGNGSAGGNGAAGGNGGVVSVINEQSLRTVGTSYASAILGESLGAIGGVGGLGGDAGAGGQGGPGGSVSDTTSGFIGGASCIGQTLTGGGCTVTLNWAAGASGNAGIASTSVGVTSFTGGNGSSVTIANSGTIRTAGLNSDAIMAISMGGVHGLSDYNPNNVYRNGLVKNISNQVMSQTGGAGNVSSTNTGGTIVTTGDRSSAIMSLSVGAGYGAGTATAANTGRLETLGNDSPAMVAASRVYALAGLTGANAANVTATNNAGTIVTSGAASHGIEAESWSEIGAAGSVIVNSNSGYIGLFGSGNVSAIRALSHAQGDSAAAGDVTVTNRSGQIISTTAGSAYTVDAHSISADGNAGAVSFDNTGGYLWSNSTAGSVYLGSLLQGTVGSRTSGAVSATNASSIISTAFGSTALTLESVTGNLVVSNGGLIQGGATGSAISFVGGNNNTITNDDSIDPQDTARLLTFGSVQDVVIRATGGNDTVNNLNGAYIRGSIHLGTGSNALNNNSTALGAKSLIESGSVVNLGGGTFTNGARGYWSPGGLGVILSPSTDGGRAANGVTLTGNFVQQAGGHLVMDVNYASGSSRVDYGDHISVTGTATLGGFVTLRPSTGAAKQGQRTITLLTATGGITATPTISIHPFFAKDDYSDGVPSTTAIFTPSLEVAGNNLNLVYDVDYTPDYLTPNQNAVANQIINIQNTGVPTYQLIAGQLLNITDPVDYQKALDSLSGEGVTATQQATFAARGRFADTTLSSATALLVCDEELKSQDPEACDRGARRWAVMDSTKMTQKGNLNEAGTATTIGSFFAGFEGRLNSFSVLGVSFGYSKGTFAVDNRWTSGQSDSLNTSLYYAAQASNGWGAKAMVLGGLTQNQYQRFAMGNKVKGESDSYSLGYGLELFYRGSVGFLNVSPFVSVFNDRQHQAKHAEDDTQWGNDYKTQRVSSRPVTVGFTLDGKIGSGQHVLLPKLRYAVKQEKASLDRQLTAASLSAPDFYWTIDGVKPPKQQRLLELDMKLRLSQHTHISFKAHKNWSHGHMNKGGSLKLESSF